MRQRPAYRLIGAPVPQLVSGEHIWRLFMRPSEEPWAADHKIQGDTVYPAVGYIAMALEAARQLATEGRKLRAFRLRDVRFLAPAEINESDATEMTISLRPAREGDDEWSYFSVSTCSDGTSIKRNCTGLICIDYERDGDSPAAHEERMLEDSIRARLKEAQELCTTRVCPDTFYDELSRIGLKFGPAFRNVAEISKRKDKSFCLVNIVNPAGERDAPFFQETRPFIIHPATFDPITQTIMAATGVEYCTPTPIPIAVDEMVIAADILYQEGGQLAVLTDVTNRGRNDLRSDIHVLEPGSLRHVLSMNGFRVAQIAKRSSASDASSYHMCSKILTAPSIELLKAEDIPQLLDTLAKQKVSPGQPSSKHPLTDKLIQASHVFCNHSTFIAGSANESSCSSCTWYTIAIRNWRS
jgi:acyl transferase domain-containing protein